MATRKKERRKHRTVAPAHYRQRTYRQRVQAEDRAVFQVICQETDLMIQADAPMARAAREHVLDLRHQIEAFIAENPGFAAALVPWPAGRPAPAIVQRMIAAGRAAGVGPMAAVAGAVAEAVGRRLMTASRQVVVENGGDVFVRTDQPTVAALFAGASPLSMRVGIRVPASPSGIGVCTSSATVGHSLSKGRADAVCVLSPDTALADAAATSIGNRVSGDRDIDAAIDFGRKIDGVTGIVIVVDARIGAWGSIELLPLAGKKG